MKSHSLEQSFQKIFRKYVNLINDRVVKQKIGFGGKSRLETLKKRNFLAQIYFSSGLSADSAMKQK